MSTFFEKLYKTKQSDKGRHQRENFLTEIFAHCLKVDEIFRINFLKMLKINTDCVPFKCDTQVSVKQIGIFDIFIEIGQEIKIIVECKVGSLAGDNQLEKYADYLAKSDVTSKYLVYLTRGHEYTEPINGVTFRHIRWFDIYELLQFTSNQLLKELCFYLKEHKMDIPTDPFVINDINAIAYIGGAVQKMRGFLQRLEAAFWDFNLNKFHYDKIDRISWGWYGMQTDFGEGKLWLGFYQWDDQEMNLCIEYFIPSIQNRKKLTNFFKLADWETYSEIDTTHWFKSQSLSNFLVDEIFDTSKAMDFIKNHLNELKSPSLV